MFDIRIFHHHHTYMYLFSCVVLFKEFCSLYFHDNADQRNIIIVLFRVSYIIYTLKTLIE